MKTNGAQGRNRTTDTRIFSPLLYRLSYLGITLYVVALSLLRILAMLRIAPLLIPASNQRLLSFRLRLEMTRKIAMAARRSPRSKIMMDSEITALRKARIR